MKYEESGKYFIKVGVDAPENLFAYEDFDATPNALGFRKQWEPHNKDFETAAAPFLWQGEKGKNLLGAINYLASEELNVFSFLTFNVDGDDRNVFPYLLKVSHSDYENYASNKENKNAWDSLFHRTRLDVSKLEQWEHILEYAETKGMFLHFKTHETETDHLMDGWSIRIGRKTLLPGADCPFWTSPVHELEPGRGKQPAGGRGDQGSQLCSMTWTPINTTW